MTDDDFYYLNDDNSIRPCTFREWADQLRKMYETNTKHVGNEVADGKRISTVWLGLNYNSFEGPPIVFETMVFDEDRSVIYCKRYSSWNEALKGHKKAVKIIKRLESLSAIKKESIN